MASEPVRLLAKGVPVVLADGEEYRLIVDLEALCVIEEEAGSLLSFLADRSNGYSGRKIKAIRTGLHAGLAHTGLSTKRIDSLIDHRSLEALQRYDDAIGEAVNQGLPDSEASASGKASSGTSDSTGTTSTGSEPSTSADAQPSSGA